MRSPALHWHRNRSLSSVFLVALLVSLIALSPALNPAPAKAQFVSTIAIIVVGSAMIGAATGGIGYAVGTVLTGDEFQGTELATAIAVGAAFGAGASLIYFISPGPLAAVFGAAASPAVAAGIEHALGDVFNELAQSAQNPDDVLSTGFKDSLANLRDNVGDRLRPTIDALLVANGGDIVAASTLPAHVDLGEEISTLRASVTAEEMPYSTFYGTRYLNVRGTSYVQVEFELANNIEYGCLDLLHLSSLVAGEPNGGSSPIDLYINESLVRDNYDVADTFGDHSWHHERWAIGEHLLQGTNTVRIELAESPGATSNYWIREISIAEGCSPPDPVVIASSSSTGTISPSGSFSIVKGETQIFEALANPGYLPNNWYIDGQPVPAFAGAENVGIAIDDDTFVYVDFVREASATSLLEVAGSPAPDPYQTTLAADGPFKELRIPVRNVGENLISVSVTTSGTAAGWASPETLAFLLPPATSVEHRVRLGVPADTQSGVYTLSLSYNDVSLPISIRVVAPGDDYPLPLNTGSGTVDGSTRTEVCAFDNPSRTYFDISGQYQTFAQTYCELSDETISNAVSSALSVTVRNVAATGNTNLLVYLNGQSNSNQVGDFPTYAVGIGSTVGRNFSDISPELLQSGPNVVSFRLQQFFSTSDPMWRIFDTVSLSTTVTNSAWQVGEGIDIPDAEWTSISDGFMNTARVYADIDSVSRDGRVCLFNSGEQVDCRNIDSGDVGDRTYWRIARDELEQQDNSFTLRAASSSNPYVRLSDAELIITFNDNEPVLTIEKTLDSSSVLAGAMVTAQVRIENVQPRSSTGFDTRLIDVLPEGATLVSGSLNATYGRLESGDVETNTYTFRTGDPAALTLPAASVEYESIAGDEIVDESNRVELIVLGGRIAVQATLTPPTFDSEPVVMAARVTELSTSASLENASVDMIIERWMNEEWIPSTAVPLGWIDADSLFRGVGPPLATGQYRARVVAELQLYEAGSSENEIFSVETSPISMSPSIVNASDGVYADRIDVDWSSVLGATTYELYRCESASPTTCGSPVATHEGVQHTDTTAQPGVSYYYRVSACNTAGCSGLSGADIGERGIQPPLDQMLSISIVGAGSVVSSPAGINCPSDCSASYPDATSVSLQAAPSEGAEFIRWSGACSGDGTCAVVMDRAQIVIAEFSEPPPPECGDGILNPESEECDDGNLSDGDGCSALCQDESCNGLVARLDDNTERLGLDRDIFTLEGSNGEAITASLYASPDEISVGAVSLLLVDAVNGATLFQENMGDLPMAISTSLPDTGRYLIVVDAVSSHTEGEAYRGGYCLELESTAGAADTLGATTWTE